MGKKGKWLSAVKNAFRSSSKDAPKTKENFSPNTKGNVQGNTPHKGKEENSQFNEKQIKRPKEKRRWSFGGKSGRLDLAPEEGKHSIQPVGLAPEESKHSIQPVSKSTVILEKNLSQAEEQTNKHALAVAAATAAAAEAAVAAAHAAVEVARLTGAPCLSSYGGANIEDWAAIRIQTAYRAYLARKSLRALRGLARLQTLVKGQTVRRQATMTLRYMQALVRVQARVRARRVHISEEGQAKQRLLWQKRRQEILTQKVNVEEHNQHGWDDSVQSLKDIETKKLSKQEAVLKRERALAYAYGHQMWRSSAHKSNGSTYIDTIDTEKPHWGWSWLEWWMAARPWEAHHLHERDVASIQLKVKTSGIAGKMPVDSFTPQSCYSQHSQFKYGTLAMPHKQQYICSESTPPPRSRSVRKAPFSMNHDEECSVASTARSSTSFYSFGGPKYFSVRNSIAGSSIRDDESLTSMPAVPSYMAATQSARAKARSLSNPKQRPLTPEAYVSVSAKKRLSFPVIEAHASDTFSTPKQLKNTSITKRSPSLRGFPAGTIQTERSTAADIANGDTAQIHSNGGQL